MAMTEPQKRYEKKRAKQCKTYAIKYTPPELIESNRLQTYLATANTSANSYIKALIKSDLDAKGIPYPDDSESDGNVIEE